jgi:hypothetical protein
VVLKIGGIYITLCSLSCAVLMLHRDEQATKLTSIQFPFDWYAIQTNLTILDRIRSKSNVRSGAS